MLWWPSDYHRPLHMCQSLHKDLWSLTKNAINRNPAFFLGGIATRYSVHNKKVECSYVKGWLGCQPMDCNTAQEKSSCTQYLWKVNNNTFYIKIDSLLHLGCRYVFVLLLHQIHHVRNDSMLTAMFSFNSWDLDPYGCWCSLLNWN